jgi:hypothetical protein
MSLGTIGNFSRQTPRIRVTVGWEGDAKSSFCESLPVASGQTIVSGQLITKTSNSGVWQFQLATPTRIAAGDLPFFAYFDSTDPATLAANALLGISCSGKFELETAFYDAGTYNPGTLLAASTAVNGNVMARTSGLFQIGVANGTNSLLGTYPNLEENSETDGSGSSWRTAGGNVLVVQTAYQPVIS